MVGMAIARILRQDQNSHSPFQNKNPALFPQGGVFVLNHLAFGLS